MSPAPTRPLRTLLLGLALAALTTGLYLRTWDFAFQYDDNWSILTNPSVRIEDWTLHELSTAARWGQRPLSDLTMAISYGLGGEDPAWFRSVSTILHGLNALLVFFLFISILRVRPRREPLLSDVDTAWLAALVWALHPLHPSAVTYIHQRPVLLAAFFSLLALLAYFRARTSSGRRWPWWTAAVVGWLTACLCKEVALALPGVVLAAELCLFQTLHKENLRRHWKLLTLLGVIVAGLGTFFISQYSLHWLQSRYELVPYTPWERVMTEWRVLVRYLGLLVFPHPSQLSVDHYVPLSRDMVEPVTTAVCAGLLLALLVASLVYARRQPLLCFAGLCFFALSALEGTVLPIELIEEYRMYLPAALLLLAAISGLQWLLPPRATRTAWLVCLGLALTFGWWTDTRNEVWRTPLALWTDAHAKAPLKYRSHYNYALSLRNEGRLEEAMREFIAIVRTTPKMPNTRRQLAACLVELGRPEDGLAVLEEGVDLQPRNEVLVQGLAVLQLQEGGLALAEKMLWRLQELRPYDPYMISFAGHLREAGRREDALTVVDGVIEHVPRRLPKAHHLRGTLLIELNRPEEAVQSLRTLISIQPGNVDGLSELGYAYQQLGEHGKALRQYKRILDLRPRDAETHINAAIAELRMQKVDAGVRRLENVLEQLPDNVRALDTLGTHYLRIGAKPQAESLFVHLLAVAPDFPGVQDKLRASRGE